MTQPARLLAALGPDAHGPADADLLARFARHRDAGAFELLVYRHAPLVLRTCRGVLRDRHAAEDAAQAVFLALARQSVSVRGDTLPGWLFRVSRRVATRAARRQPPRTADVALDALPNPTTAAPDPAEVRVLHDELARLPAAYRDPLLLLYFEGLTRDEAARRLGWPAGTVAGRVARAKQRLADRLARRGVTLGALVVTVEAVPPGFAGATAEAAVAYVAGGATGVGQVVAGLATQELRRMAMGKAAKLVRVVLAFGAVALGLGVAAEGEPPAAPPVADAKAQPSAPANPAPPKAVFGKGFVVAPVTTDLQRRLILFGGPDSAAYVSVDGTKLFPDDKTLSVAALDVKGIRDALAGFGPGAARAAHFDVYFVQGPWKGPEYGSHVVTFALEGFGRQAGFGQSRAVTTAAFGTWEDHVAPLRDVTGASAREDGLGDDRVVAYPVRTPLGRVLAGRAGGVVDVRVRISGRVGDPVPVGVDGSVRVALRGLGLPRGSRVSFLFDGTDRSEEIRTRVDGLAVAWAEAQGLESAGAWLGR